MVVTRIHVRGYVTAGDFLVVSLVTPLFSFVQFLLVEILSIYTYVRTHTGERKNDMGMKNEGGCGSVGEVIGRPRDEDKRERFIIECHYPWPTLFALQ